MSVLSLEERVQKLERRVVELETTLGRDGQKARSLPPSTGPVDDAYWEERERRLSRINFIQPIDSTAVVSDDRDRG